MLSLKKFVKIGIVHFMIFPETSNGENDILDSIKKIVSDEYFDLIEVAWIKDPEIREKAAKLIDISKITVCYGAHPRLLTTGLNPNHLIEEERMKAVETLKDAVDEAWKLGSKSMVFLSGQYEEQTKEESYKQLIKTTKELCEYAKQKDIDIVLEIFDYDVAKKSLIGPTKLAKRYAEEIKKEHSNFGLLVDLGHIPIYHESVQEALGPIKEHILHVHIGNAVVSDSNAEGYGDEHIRFGFPNSENNVEQLTEFLRELIKIGYLTSKEPKPISFEIKPWKDEDPDLVIANAKRTLNDAWIRLNME